jgi:hypothetical protein
MSLGLFRKYAIWMSKPNSFRHLFATRPDAAAIIVCFPHHAFALIWIFQRLTIPTCSSDMIAPMNVRNVKPQLKFKREHGGLAVANVPGSF